MSECQQAAGKQKKRELKEDERMQKNHFLRFIRAVASADQGSSGQ